MPMNGLRTFYRIYTQSVYFKKMTRDQDTESITNKTMWNNRFDFIGLAKRHLV